VRITDTDLEYLLSTLSEARSRATEISVAVHSRVGGGHRLSELGNSAVSQIENLLQQIRKAAADEPSTAPDHIRSARPAETTEPAQQSEKVEAMFAPARYPESQHWFHEFINELLEHFLASGDITFETVERALARRKEAFLKELEVTQRMYRTYPHLFKEIESRTP